MEDLGVFGIIFGLILTFWPVWLAMGLTLFFSWRYRARLGLYGQLYDNTVGVAGLSILFFWLFAAILADFIAPFGVYQQLGDVGTFAAPGTINQATESAVLLGTEKQAYDILSRVIYGSQVVLIIAPAATLFALLVGTSLGLPAGYFGGRVDTVLSFIANLLLAFPVILLFYLLATKEIQETALPKVMAGFFFLFPIAFFLTLFYTKFKDRDNLFGTQAALTVLIGGWIWLGLVQPSVLSADWAFVFVAALTGFILLLSYMVLHGRMDLFLIQATMIVGFAGVAWFMGLRSLEYPATVSDPLGVISLTPGELTIFVSVVFASSPGVFRIVRGLVIDVKTRDYVAAAQTRGESPWYIMLWEVLPNARGPLIVDGCLRVGYTAILLGTLGIFGLGVESTSPDWGTGIKDAAPRLRQYIFPVLPPALSLMSFVLGFNLLADALREESLKD